MSSLRLSAAELALLALPSAPASSALSGTAGAVILPSLRLGGHGQEEDEEGDEDDESYASSSSSFLSSSLNAAGDTSLECRPPMTINNADSSAGTAGVFSSSGKRDPRDSVVRRVSVAPLPQDAPVTGESPPPPPATRSAADHTRLLQMSNAVLVSAASESLGNTMSSLASVNTEMADGLVRAFLATQDLTAGGLASTYNGINNLALLETPASPTSSTSAEGPDSAPHRPSRTKPSYLCPVPPRYRSSVRLLQVEPRLKQEVQAPDHKKRMIHDVGAMRLRLPAELAPPGPRLVEQCPRLQLENEQQRYRLLQMPTRYQSSAQQASRLELGLETKSAAIPVPRDKGENPAAVPQGATVAETPVAAGRAPAVPVAVTPGLAFALLANQGDNLQQFMTPAPDRRPHPAGAARARHVRAAKEEHAMPSTNCGLEQLSSASESSCSSPPEARVPRDVSPKLGVSVAVQTCEEEGEDGSRMASQIATGVHGGTTATLYSEPRPFLWVAPLARETADSWTVPQDGTVAEALYVAADRASPFAAPRLWPPAESDDGGLENNSQAAEALSVSLGRGGPRVSVARGAYIPPQPLPRASAAPTTASVMASSEYNVRLTARLAAINAELQRIEHTANDLEREFVRLVC